MQGQIVSQAAGSAPQPAARLHYLDCLRIIAILMVFVIHLVHVFDTLTWHIKNAQQSAALTFFVGFLYPWGMPFFFLIAGAGSWFALQRRSARQFTRERVLRLLIPFVAGSLLLMPVMLYFEWRQKVATGALTSAFAAYALDRPIPLGPHFFSWAGNHLWFIGFLFTFSLLALPLLLWLKRTAGQRFIAWLAQLCERRGGILVFILPLTVVQFLFRPFFPEEQDWADFFFFMTFFMIGSILFADERFARAIRRDGWLALPLGIVAFIALGAVFAVGQAATWSTTPTLPQFYLFWFFTTVDAWVWPVFMLMVGMKWLNFSNAGLRYAQQAIVPFYVFHQPVIIVLAFFIVQWAVAVPLKMLMLGLAAFLLTLAIYELLIRRFAPLRVAFGVKGRLTSPSAALGLSSSTSSPVGATEAFPR